MALSRPNAIATDWAGHYNHCPDWTMPSTPRLSPNSTERYYSDGSSAAPPPTSLSVSVLVSLFRSPTHHDWFYMASRRHLATIPTFSFYSAYQKLAMLFLYCYFLNWCGWFGFSEDSYVISVNPLYVVVAFFLVEKKMLNVMLEQDMIENENILAK